MKFILAKKIEMTERFRETGEVVPVTVLQAGPCVVTQIKTSPKDGYEAVQVGFGPKKKLAKPVAGHLKGLPNSRYLREFRLDGATELKRGDMITVSIFQPGDAVKAIGTSKGKGFQGVMKRHGFHGSPATHGHKDQMRMPGSIGATAPQRVVKGRRMAGHMGDQRSTVANLEVVEVDTVNNLLFVKGAVPGARNNLIIISAPGEMKLAVPSVAEKQEATPVAAPAEKSAASPAEPAADKK